MRLDRLVELIVLNIGLQAGILNDEIFAMFVLMGKPIISAWSDEADDVLSTRHYIPYHSLDPTFLPGVVPSRND